MLVAASNLVRARGEARRGIAPAGEVQGRRGVTADLGSENNGWREEEMGAGRKNAVREARIGPAK